MTISARKALRVWWSLGMLGIALACLSPPVFAREIVFKDVKKRGILEEKVVETANMYADVLQFDVKGKVKDELITETINVIVPRGNMTPGEVMLETTLKKTYVVVPQRNRTFSGRKQVYWAWTVTAIGSDNTTGFGSANGF